LRKKKSGQDYRIIRIDRINRIDRIDRKLWDERHRPVSTQK